MSVVKILDNIFLSNELVIGENFINDNNIKNIILVELDTDQLGFNQKISSTYTITITANPPTINFDYTNDIILSSISNCSGNLLIVSKNNILGFIIMIGFMMKYLKVSLLECLILGISKNIVGINESIYIKHLNEYHLYLRDNK